MPYKRKYNTGGNIGSAIGAGATSFIPGVGPALAPIGGAIGGAIGGLFDKKPEDPTVVGYAHQGYKYGGKLKYPTGGKLMTPTAAKPMGNGARKYQGPQHEQGGIPIDQLGNPTDPTNATAEVQGNETIQDDYIFSNELKVPETNMTFAQMHEKLVNNDAPQEQIQQLMQMQEQLKQQSGQQDSPQMFNGGFTDPAKRMNRMNYLAGKNSTRTANTVAPVNTQAPQGNTDYLGIAQRLAPSVTRLASAAFAPKPKPTKRLQAQQIDERNPQFNAAKSQLGAGFRGASNGNPQGAYAQYIQGLNRVTAAETGDTLRRQQINAGNQQQVDQFNIQSEVADNERQYQDTGARMSLVDQAIQAPLTAAATDRASKQKLIGDIMTSADRITNPTSWAKTVRARLKAIGLPEQEINNILSEYQR